MSDERETQKCLNWIGKGLTVRLLYEKLIELKRSRLSDSAQLFMDNTGHDIIHLFNDVLLEKDDLISIIKENDVINLSPKVPGLIIQAYLVLVEIFNLDVMEPLRRVKEEVQLVDTGIVFDEDPEASNQLAIENVSQGDSGLVKTV